MVIDGQGNQIRATELNMARLEEHQSYFQRCTCSCNNVFLEERRKKRLLSYSSLELLQVEEGLLLISNLIDRALCISSPLLDMLSSYRGASSKNVKSITKSVNFNSMYTMLLSAMSAANLIRPLILTFLGILTRAECPLPLAVSLPN